MGKNIVYFLGAGASKNFGYPLTSDIMPEILLALRKNDLFEIGNRKTELERNQEKQLLLYLYKLYPGLKTIDIRKQKSHIPNITEILSFIDHCCFYNMPPHPELNDDTLQNFRQLLNRAIGELLLYYENIPYKPEENELLSKFINPVKAEKKNSNVTIITTNYDLTIDREIYGPMRSNKVDFGIPYRHIGTSQIIGQPVDPLVRYYKLHGSLNWTRCDLCGYYYINPHGSIVHQAFKTKPGRDNTCICSDTLRLKSVLVAPSIVRDIRDSNLLQIWKASMESIRTADELTFIGYSLPPEDLAIKSIIMRGINGRNKKRPPVVSVVQLGDSAKQNYVNLFGKDITYYSKGLSQYLSKQ